MNFSVTKSFRALVATAPFLVFRVLVYLGVVVLYLLGVGVGGSLGYFLTLGAEEPGSGVGIGGVSGFVLSGAVVYWLRETLLYAVKAGHIAVLVKWFDGESLPAGQSQITYARDQVTQRFGQASILFLLDKLIKGVLKAFNRTVMALSTLIPIPGLQGLVSIAGKVIETSLTFVDELILAYCMRVESENPWQDSRAALILYAQNYKIMLKSAVVLTVFAYIFALVIFLLVLGPFSLLVANFEAVAGFWGFALAVVFAWALKAALIEPFMIACMMQSYFAAIENQEPEPEWERRLEAASDKFSSFADKAKNYIRPANSSTDSNTGTNETG